MMGVKRLTMRGNPTLRTRVCTNDQQIYDKMIVGGELEEEDAKKDEWWWM